MTKYSGPPNAQQSGVSKSRGGSNWIIMPCMSEEFGQKVISGICIMMQMKVDVRLVLGTMPKEFVKITVGGCAQEWSSKQAAPSPLAAGLTP